MKGFRVATFLGLAVVLLAAPVWANQHLQTQKKAPGGTFKGGEGGAIKGDPPVKVEITNFSITPAQPTAGDQVTVILTIKNTGSGTVAKVPWSIHRATGNQTLASTPDIMGLQPGQSVTKTATWQAQAGQQLLQGYVDPTGKALKNTVPVTSQIRELTLNVPWPVKVEAKALTITPTNPKAGDQVTIRLTIENKGGGAVSVPWLIHHSPSNQTLKEFTVEMGPNSVKDRVVQWTAEAGAGKLQGKVMPLKNTAAAASQIKELTLNVASAVPPVKVEATALTITPANPKSGDQVTVKLTIKNTGTGTVAKVNWGITDYTGNQMLKEGEKANLPAGSSFEVTAPWTAQAGARKLLGDVLVVDSTGKTLTNTAPSSSQNKMLDVTVAAPNLVQQILSGDTAKQAGAQFAGNLESPSPCNTEQRTDWPGWSVRLTLLCPPGAGGRADPEGFKNFQLKNGWKVKSVSVEAIDQHPGSDWQWRQRPSESSRDPYLKFHLVNGGGTQFEIGVKITIEGPEGTNPYTN